MRSKPLDELKNEIAELEKNGFSEIVLVGINLSAYGMGTDKNIVDAVKLAASFDGIKRVRLGSLEPDHITDEIIDGLSGISEFCPQFHISLQSGCDATLKRMNRHYNSAEYYSLCNKLRNAFDGTTLTTDIMVGFPGETDEYFTESLEFVKKVGFEKVHVFPYSIRPGTPAAKMTDQIEKCEKEKRAAIMSAATEEIRQSFLESQIGKTLEVLIEEYHGGYAQGFTKNYTPVKIACDENLHGIIKTKITAVDGDFCIGTL